jgi:hypothetical protein
MSRVDNDECALALDLRAVRLRMLQRALEQAERQGNIALAVIVLEQAAKEMGRDLPIDQPEIPTPAVAVVVLG